MIEHTFVHRAGPPPAHVPAADPAGPCARIPPAGRGRLDTRGHRSGAPGHGRDGAGRGRRARRADRPHRRHAHAPGSPRRDAAGRRGHGRAGVPGRARLRADRARVGQPGVAADDLDLVPLARRPGRGRGRAHRAGLALRAVHPLPAGPVAPVAKATSSTAGGSSRCRATPTATSASSGTASSSRATTCSTGSRRPSASGRTRARTRSATTSTRWSAPSTSGRGSSIPGTASRSATQPCARVSSSTTTGSGSTPPRPCSGSEPRTGYEVSFDLFPRATSSGARRFAVAETLSHLERLRREGRAERLEDDGVVRWRR